MTALGPFGKYWRIAVQIFSYGVFGIGALFVALFFFPVIHLAPIHRDKKTVRVQWVIHYLFRLFLGLISLLRGMDFKWVNGQTIPCHGPFLLVANHPTLLDVVLLVSQIPQADCVVKGELFNNPFLFLVVKCAGYIPNSDGTAVVQEAVARILKGRNVIVFPEGTRSSPDRLKPFELGFAHIAVRADCVVLPVFLKCSPAALSKGNGLFSVPSQKAQLQGQVGTPAPASRYYTPGVSRFVAVRELANNIHRLFQENLGYDEPSHRRRT